MSLLDSCHRHDEILHNLFGQKKVDNRDLSSLVVPFSNKKKKKKTILFITAVEHRSSVSIIAYELTIMPRLACTSSVSGLATRRKLQKPETVLLGRDSGIEDLSSWRIFSGVLPKRCRPAIEKTATLRSVQVSFSFLLVINTYMFD